MPSPGIFPTMTHLSSRVALVAALLVAVPTSRAESTEGRLKSFVIAGQPLRSVRLAELASAPDSWEIDRPTETFEAIAELPELETISALEGISPDAVRLRELPSDGILNTLFDDHSVTLLPSLAWRSSVVLTSMAPTP